jgi:hypothetical protein
MTRSLARRDIRPGRSGGPALSSRRRALEADRERERIFSRRFAMSPDVLRIGLAVVLIFHGIGHVLFLAPALRLASWADQTGASWLLGPAFGDGIAHAAGAVIWAVSAVLFVGAACGLLLTQEWWRPVAVAGAVVSVIGIVAFWGGIAPSSAVAALVVDAIVIVGLLVVRWPSATTIGA